MRSCLSAVVLMLVFSAENPAYSAAIETAELAEIFDAVGDPPLARSETWGSLDFSSHPWIRTSSFGWIYLNGEATPENYWFWVNGVGWLNSSATQFPLCYLVASEASVQNGRILMDYTDRFRIKYWHFEERKWIIAFRPDTVIQGAPQWYVDFLNSGYRPENEEDLLLYQFYGGVPGNLVGLVAQNPYIEKSPSEYAYTQIRIGPYWLLKIDYSLRGAYLTTVYYYDQFNDTFYPAERRINNNLSPVVGLEDLKVTVDDSMLFLEASDGEISNYRIISEE